MKVFRAFAKVTALISTIGAMIPGPWQPFFALNAAVWSTISSLTSKPKGSAIGSQTEVQLNPWAGVPYLIGTTFFAGVLAHQDTFGGDTNKYIGSVIVYSGAGPISGTQSWQVDRATVTFSGGVAGGEATGQYENFLWLDAQLGACPEANALASSEGSLPNWGASHKLSGKAAALWTLKFDKKAKKFAAGYPQTGGIHDGVLVYDPRLDSTYPGGSGSCRSDDESTWVFSECPALHGIAWSLGRHQNGKRVMGVGMPATGIDMARWVEFANVCDANDWKVGGVVSSLDDKWETLKNICQAGGGEPIRLGGLLSVDFHAPRVSLATITSADLVGEAKAARTRQRKNRINTIVPRFRSPGHGYEVISADPVEVASLVTLDGGSRTREMDYPLVQDLDQAAELAAYDAWETREFPVAPLQLRTIWMGYKPGDCLTVDIPELLPDPVDIVVTRRALDPQSLVVTLEGLSETADKHDVLGTTGTAPPEPDLEPGDFPIIDSELDLLIANSDTIPTAVLSYEDTGTDTTVTVIEHTRLYADGVSVLLEEQVLTGLTSDTPYGFYYDDLTRSDTTPTIVATTTPADALPGAAEGRHCLGFINTPAAGSGDTGEGGGSSSGGGTIPREPE